MLKKDLKNGHRKAPIQVTLLQVAIEKRWNILLLVLALSRLIRSNSAVCKHPINQMDQCWKVQFKNRQIWARDEQNGCLRQRYITWTPSVLSFSPLLLCAFLLFFFFISPFYRYLSSCTLPPSLWLSFRPCNLTASCVIEDDREGI